MILPIILTYIKMVIINAKEDTGQLFSAKNWEVSWCLVMGPLRVSDSHAVDLWLIWKPSLSQLLPWWLRQ